MVYIRILFLLFLLQLGFIASAQPIMKQKGEALKSDLEKNLNDTVKILKLQELSLYYVKKLGELKADIDSSYVYAREAELLSFKANFQRGKLMSLILYSQIYREGGNDLKGRKELNKAFAIAKKNKLLWLEGEAYRELTNYYELNGNDFLIRLENVKKALQAFQKGGYKKDVGDILVYYGGHYFFMGKYKEALQKYKEAKVVYDAIGNKDLQNLYSQIFKTYSKLGLYQDAIKYGLISIKYGERDKNLFFLVDDYQSLGNAYNYIDNYKLALKYHKKGFEYSGNMDAFTQIFLAGAVIKDLLKLERKTEAKHFLDTAFKNLKLKDQRDLMWFNMCQVYVYDALGWYAVADKYCNEIIKIKQKNEKYFMKTSSFEVNNTIINHFFKVKKYDLALKYLDINKKTAKSIKDINMIIDGHLMGFKLDSASGNYLSAIANLKKYQKLKDSLFNEVKSYQISNLEIQYQTENKDQNIQLLTKESALQKAKIKSDKVAKIIVALVLFLVLIITGLIFRGYQNKKQSNRELEESKNNIEKQNKILQNVVQEKEWLLKEIHHRV
ncbi:MAG: hypothetical protein ABI892_17050, partial [Flavobacterium sp.]